VTGYVVLHHTRLKATHTLKITYGIFTFWRAPLQTVHGHGLHATALTLTAAAVGAGGGGGGDGREWNLIVNATTRGCHHRELH
jgi:hypothetical protein